MYVEIFGVRVGVGWISSRIHRCCLRREPLVDAQAYQPYEKPLTIDTFAFKNRYLAGTG